VSEGTGGGSGDGRPASTAAGEDSVVRYEEEPRVDIRTVPAGSVRARREVTSRHVRERHARHLEQLAHERVPVEEGDSGEVELLADGSVSVPLFEEELVVERRQVLRERVIIRKELVTEWQTVEVNLRREHVAFETDE